MHSRPRVIGSPLPGRAGRPAVRRPAAAAGFTLIELVVVLVVVGILATIAVVNFTGDTRGQSDRAGTVLMGVVRTDASAVAATAGYTFPGAQGTLDALNNAEKPAGDGTAALTYLPPDPDTGAAAPSTDSGHVSYAYADAGTLGFGLLTSAGNGTDGHCLLMVDTLHSGARYAATQDATATSCTADVILACYPSLQAGQLPAGVTGSGTSSDPWTLSRTTSCTTPTAAPVTAPMCLVATPGATQHGTAAVQLSWTAPPAGTDLASYTITVTGDVNRTVTGVAADATAYLVDGLAPGGTYSFAIAAVSADGTAAAPVDSNANLQLAPAAPDITVTATGDGYYDVTWAAVPGAVSYTVSRTPDFNATVAPRAVNIPASAAVDGQLTFTDPGSDTSSRISYTFTVSATITAVISTHCGETITSGGTSTSAPVSTPSS